MYTYLSVGLMIMSMCVVQAGDDAQRQRKNEAFWRVQRLHAGFRVPRFISVAADVAATQSDIKSKAEEVLREATPTNDTVRDILAFIVSDMNANEPK